MRLWLRSSMIGSGRRRRRTAAGPGGKVSNRAVHCWRGMSVASGVGTAGWPRRGQWVGTRARGVDSADRAGVVGARCDLLMAPVATMLIASIAAANAARTIHRVRRKPDFSIVIRGSGFGGDGAARSASRARPPPRSISSGPTTMGAGFVRHGCRVARLRRPWCEAGRPDHGRSWR